MEAVKSSKNQSKTIMLGLTIVALSMLSITFLGAGISSSSDTASALTYSNTTGLSFTFKPTLSISLSSSTINIANLVPGQVADSDPITVSVSSNTPYGYSLFASVGSSDTTSTYYNTSDLIHEDATLDTVSSAPSFTSIATNANLATLTEDNTWGYSYKSTAEGATWSTYNGLPLYSTVGDNTSTENPALLIDTKDPADSTKAIDFKLAARASSTQASGTYNNVINFYAVGKPQPMDLATAFAASGAQKTTQGYYRMQDMTSDICNVVDVEYSTLQLQDARDNKVYWVTKLADNNCWMTQNLDFNIDSTKTYTSADTDLPSGTNWKPTRSTTTGTAWDTSTTGRTVPHSYDPGNRYWNGNVTTSGGDLSNRTTTEPSANYGTHYHVGNYYNWTAAVAMNDSSSYTTDQQDVNQSICPAGWRLPTYSGDKSYQNLVSMQSLTAGTSGNIQNTPAYFVYGGYWTGSSYVVGSDGLYWSSVVRSSGNSYLLYFTARGRLYPQALGYRHYGYSLRCVAR